MYRKILAQGPNLAPEPQFWTTLIYIIILLHCAGAPAQSFVHVDRFRNVSELARHLVHLTHDERAYQKHFAWRRSVKVEGFGNVFCHLCAFLHERDIDGDGDGGSDKEHAASAASAAPGGASASGHNSQEREAVATRRSDERAACSRMREKRRGERELERERARPEVLWDVRRQCRDEHSRWPFVSSFKYYTGS